MGVKILDNCCSPTYLDCLKNIAVSSENWNLKYPEGEEFSIEDKFLKLEIINNGQCLHPVLAGLAWGLLIQIHAAGGQALFFPEITFCGISIKDKNTPNNMHIDTRSTDGLVKILGIINSDWEEEWGGEFIHNETSNYIKPTSFCIFDPAISHSAGEIFTDKKRIAIDFTVYLNERTKQSIQQVSQGRGIRPVG